MANTGYIIDGLTETKDLLDVLYYSEAAKQLNYNDQVLITIITNNIEDIIQKIKEDYPPPQDTAPCNFN